VSGLGERNLPQHAGLRKFPLSTPRIGPYLNFNGSTVTWPRLLEAMKVLQDADGACAKVQILKT
jgi:hypothetical protein